MIDKCHFYELLLGAILKCDRNDLDTLYTTVSKSCQLFGKSVLTSVREYGIELDVEGTKPLNEIVSSILNNYLESFTKEEDLPGYIFDVLWELGGLGFNYVFTLDFFNPLNISIDKKQVICNKFNTLITSLKNPTFNSKRFANVLITYYNIGYISKRLVRELIVGIEDDISMYESIIRSKIKNDTLILDINSIENTPNTKREEFSKTLGEVLIHSIKGDGEILKSSLYYVLEKVTSSF